MSKTPMAGAILGLLITVGALPPANAAGSAAAPAGNFKDAVAAGDAERPAMDFADPGSKSADLPLDAVAGQATAPLPLSQFARGARLPGRHGPFGLWDLINEVRYGGLPEPASWALMLMGFGMIGGALRGFMIANRRLADLQPEESDDIDNVEGGE